MLVGAGIQEVIEGRVAAITTAHEVHAGDVATSDAWLGEELIDPLYLQWASFDNRSTEIVRTLREAGLTVSHRGGIKKSIRIAATLRLSRQERNERRDREAEAFSRWLANRREWLAARLAAREQALTPTIH